MFTIQLQQRMEEAFRPANRIDLVKARKKRYCVACMKDRGFLVHLDYSTDKKKWNYSTFEMEIGTCPICKKKDVTYQKVKGAGISGVDSF